MMITVVVINDHLLGGRVTLIGGRFNGDVGEDVIVGATDVTGCCIGRTTAIGRDD